MDDPLSRMLSTLVKSALCVCSHHAVWYIFIFISYGRVPRGSDLYARYGCLKAVLIRASCQRQTAGIITLSIVFEYRSPRARARFALNAKSAITVPIALGGM